MPTFAPTSNTSDRDSFTEYFEYAPFYNSSGAPGGTAPYTYPFYLDSQGIWNFGYGYNLNANSTTYATELAKVGIPANVITLVKEAISGTKDATLGYTPHPSDLNAALNQTTDWRTAATTVLDDFYTTNNAQLATYLSTEGVTLASQSIGVQLALEDIAYNGGPRSKAFGTGLTGDLSSGKLGAATWEVAFDTAQSNDPGHETRYLADAIRMLGLTVTVDGNFYVTTVAGTPTDQTQVQNFLIDNTDHYTSDNPYIITPYGQSFMKAIDAYTLSQGYYVAYGDAASPDTMNLSFSGSTLQLFEPQVYGGVISGFTAGKTLDLGGIGTASGATLSVSNVLTVSAGGNLTLKLDPNQSYAGEHLVTSSDGANGTNISIVGNGTTINGSLSIGVYLTLASQNPVLVTTTGSVITTGPYAISDTVSSLATITNNGVLTASSGAGIYTSGPSSVANSGSISGLYGLEVGANSTVTNGSATSLIALITGSYNGILFGGGTNATTNFGKISAGSSGSGIAMGSSGQITIVNGSASDTKATISGFNGVQTNAGTTVTTFTNYGLITGTNYGLIIASGTVTNGGTSDTAASIAGAYALTVAGSGTVYNYGGLTGGSSGYGASLGSASLTNYANASITGAYGVEGGTTITNDGTIKGSYEGIVTSGTVINYGSIIGGSSGVAIQFGSTGNLVEKPGSVISGKVFGGSLELANGTSGGTIGGLGTNFTGLGAVTVDAGSTWTFTGPNTAANIVDNGTVAIANSSSLDVSLAIDPSSSGIFQLTGKATFEVAAALGTKEKIQFLAGTTGNELIVDKASSFGTQVGSTSYAGALLENFTAGDIIDLKGIASTGLQLAYSTTSGDLQITGGGALATLLFQNSTLGGGAFHTASDGSGGILITHG